MVRTVSLVLVAFLNSGLLSAQESAREERAMMERALMERLESSIQIILKMDPAAKKEELELVEEQNERLAKLDEEYQRMIGEIQNLQNAENAAEATKLFFMEKMSRIQETLHTDILLPHQSSILDSLVFTQFVKHHGGSILRAVKTYYSREFGLTDNQKKDLAKIEKQTAEKVAAAQEEFRKKLEEIAKETNTEVRKLLSPEQIRTLDKLQNRKKESTEKD